MDFVPIIFKIEEEEFGSDINYVDAVEMASGVDPAGIKSENIKEEIDYRGKRIPVFNLKNKFGIKKKAHHKNEAQVNDCNVKKNEIDDDVRYIIVRTKEIQIAIYADSIEKIDVDSEKKLYDLPALIQSEATQCYDKILKIGDRIVMILNIDQLLTKQEIKQIADQNRSTR